MSTLSPTAFAAVLAAAGFVVGTPSTSSAAYAAAKPLTASADVKVGDHQYLAAEVSLNRASGAVTGLFTENNGNKWQGYTAACIVLFYGRDGELLDLRVTRGFGIDACGPFGSTNKRFIPLRETIPRGTAGKVSRMKVIVSKTGRGFDASVRHLRKLAEEAKKVGG